MTKNIICNYNKKYGNILSNIPLSTRKQILDILKKTERKIIYQDYDRKSLSVNIKNDRISFVFPKEISIDFLNENFDDFADIIINNSKQINCNIIEETVEKQLLFLALHSAILELNDIEQKIIIAYYYYDFSERKLSELLHIPKSTIHYKKNQALKTLKKNCYHYRFYSTKKEHICALSNFILLQLTDFCSF